MSDGTPFDISISEYDYELPANRIAVFPLEERDASKLLVYKQGKISHTSFVNLTAELPEDAFLVFNNTKVTKARLKFLNERSQTIELFCLEPHHGGDMSLAMSSKGTVRWNCLVGNLKKWKEGVLKMVQEGVDLTAAMVAKESGHVVIEFRWEPEQLSFAEVLQRFGNIPIPPYLNRESEAIDTHRYQTVYAKQEGSVAAPTAGLHFTERVLQKMQAASLQSVEITLHVGAGTFKLVKSDVLRDHDMHAELIEFDRTTLEKILEQVDKTIVCVGTTSLRTLESIYWMGLKVYHEPGLELADLAVRQWEPYEPGLERVSAEKSLGALLSWMKERNHDQMLCATRILIAPPYDLKIAKGIITNFHQPRSTLLLLIGTIAGDNWKQIYDYALEHEFRFLSYGDSSLLLK